VWVKNLYYSYDRQIECIVCTWPYICLCSSGCRWGQVDVIIHLLLNAGSSTHAGCVVTVMSVDCCILICVSTAGYVTSRCRGSRFVDDIVAWFRFRVARRVFSAQRLPWRRCTAPEQRQGQLSRAAEASVQLSLLVSHETVREMHLNCQTTFSKYWSFYRATHSAAGACHV